VIPAPLPLGAIFPASVGDFWFRAVNALNMMTARAWKRGLAYQFVAIVKPREMR
jgi:hypothetical protein